MQTAIAENSRTALEQNGYRRYVDIIEMYNTIKADYDKISEQIESKKAQRELFKGFIRALEKQGQKEKAMKCYRLCEGGSFRAQATRAMAVHEKREGQYRAAARLLETMLERGDDPVFAYEALAKLYEHQFRDPEQALHYVRQALLLLAEPRLHKDEAVQEKQNELQYRYARLRRKLRQESAMP